MDHVNAIKSYIETMLAVPDQHILIIEGPPGWGKTETTETALDLAGVEPAYLGSYSTPLDLFNFLHRHPKSLILADDTDGLFRDPTSMALLKAATWPRRGNKRILRWGSTTGRADAEEFEFRGCFIVICNSFPNSPHGEAIRSRSFTWRFDVSPSQAKDLLLEAAKDELRFSNTTAAVSVARFLASRVTEDNISSISYRTLSRAYRLAEVHPNSWEKLVAPLIPQAPLTPEGLVKELAGQKLKVKDQIRIFEEKTSLKARSFYYYRRAADLSRSAD